MSRPPLLRLRVLLWHARPALVLLALAAGAVWAVGRLAPGPPPATAVVVAARDVPAGSVLQAGDLRLARLPPDAAPDDPPGEGDLLGRTTRVDLVRGLAVVPALLEGERFGVDPPPGLVVVPVRLTGTDASALLRPGDRVDLVTLEAGDLWAEPADAAAEPAVTVLAARALVLDVGGEPDGGLLGSAPADVVTVVAVTPEEGRRLAATTASGPLGAVLVG